VIIVSAVFGQLNASFLVLFVLLAMAYGVALSVSALVMDDARTLRSQSIGDIAWLLLCTVIENFGYRQLLALWRFMAMIELLAGPVLLTSKTHRADGGRYAYNLPALPVTVTQVTVSGVVQDPSAYVVDEEAGIVYGWFAAALPLSVEITYTAGGTVVPANLILATRELVRHLWRSGRQSGNPGAMDAAADAVATPFGFAVPRKVMELCSATPSAPGFA